MYASGDSNPYDKKATGFDAIVENPQFAGADTSYWIRQAVPLIGGGGVTISGRNGVLNDLRSSRNEGQSNFTNPGIMLAGIGADLDLLPTLRVSFNCNDLSFANTAVVEVARSQAVSAEAHRRGRVGVADLPPADVAEHRAAHVLCASLFAQRAPTRRCSQAQDPGYFLLNAVIRLLVLQGNEVKQISMPD